MMKPTWIHFITPVAKHYQNSALLGQEGAADWHWNSEPISETDASFYIRGEKHVWMLSNTLDTFTDNAAVWVWGGGGRGIAAQYITSILWKCLIVFSKSLLQIYLLDKSFPKYLLKTQDELGIAEMYQHHMLRVRHTRQEVKIQWGLPVNQACLDFQLWIVMFNPLWKTRKVKFIAKMNWGEGGGNQIWPLPKKKGASIDLTSWGWSGCQETCVAASPFRIRSLT